MIGRPVVCPGLALTRMLGARSVPIANALRPHDSVTQAAPARLRDQLADELARLLKQSRPTLMHSLAANANRRVTRTLTRTVPLVRHGNLCAALRSLESATAVLSAPSSYRRHPKAVPAGAAAVASRFGRIETTIARAPGSCAVVSRVTHAHAGAPLPGHVAPLTNGEHEQGARAYTIPRLRPDA